MDFLGTGTNGGTFTLGITELSYNASDAAGNTDVCQFFVIVQRSSGQLLFPYYYNYHHYYCNYNNYCIDDFGHNRAVLLNASDAAGNTDVCQFVVIVQRPSGQLSFLYYYYYHHYYCNYYQYCIDDFSSMSCFWSRSALLVFFGLMTFANLLFLSAFCILILMLCIDDFRKCLSCSFSRYEFLLYWRLSSMP